MDWIQGWHEKNPLEKQKKPEKQNKKAHLIKPISCGFYWVILDFIVNSKLLITFKYFFNVEIWK